MQSDYFLTYVYTSSKFFINLVLSLISLKTTPMLPAITLAKAVSRETFHKILYALVIQRLQNRAQSRTGKIR